MNARVTHTHTHTRSTVMLKMAVKLVDELEYED